MDPTVNPFTPGAGTTPPELAGRSIICEHARDAIARSRKGGFSKSAMLVGRRGVGKTVLLKWIERQAEDLGCQTVMFEANRDHTLAELLTDQLRHVLLKLDRLRRVGNEVNRAFAILRGFASAFKLSYEGVQVGVAQNSAASDIVAELSPLFVAIGKAAKSRGSAVVLFIDEVQNLSEPDFRALTTALHKVAQENLPIVFYGAGLPQITTLPGSETTYAERLFDFVEVDHLDENSAREAFARPAQSKDVTFDREALDELIARTACYPYFIQVWGSEVWNAALKSPITKADVDKATIRALSVLDQGFFKLRLDALTSRQQEFVRAMAQLGVDDEVLLEGISGLLKLNTRQMGLARSGLIKKGIIYSPALGSVAFTVPGFGDFLNRSVVRT